MDKKVKFANGRGCNMTIEQKKKLCATQPQKSEVACMTFINRKK